MSSESRKYKRDALNVLWITLVYILIFQIFDLTYREVTFAPLYCSILVFFLALFYRPSLVFMVVFILIPFVAFRLLSAPSFDFQVVDSWIRLVVRILTFALAGILAVLSSFFRSQLMDIAEQSRELMARLPLAVMLSNSAGRVVWTNDAARELLGGGALEGRMYLEVLPTDGRPIDYEALFYYSLAESHLKEAVPDYDLSLMRIGRGAQRILVTVLMAPTESQV